MSKVIFTYKGIETIIQSNLNDKIEDIYIKYGDKVGIDISKWNTSNVTDMSYMFYECSSLSFLPDISKWNASNVSDMKFMLHGCSSLSFLPDISKWNTKISTKMKNIIYECLNLINLK